MEKSTEKQIKKGKVGILTILDVANFGTMLQAYALATVIREHPNLY